MRRHWSQFTAIIAALLLAGHPEVTPAADTAKADSQASAASKQGTGKPEEGTHDIESGARQIGRGIEEGAKGVGNTIAQGSKAVGRKIEEAAREAEPQARSAWQNFKHGAAEAGRSVRNFFDRLFRG